MNVYGLALEVERWSLKRSGMRARWQVQLVICRSHQSHASPNMVRGRTTSSAWGYVSIMIVHGPSRTLVIYLPRSFTMILCSAEAGVNWTVWSRKFDASGAIVDPCHPANGYLCILSYNSWTLLAHPRLRPLNGNCCI